MDETLEDILGIHFQNPAIELANPDSDRGRFKHCPKTQIAVIIACRRKLRDHVHTDTALKNFQVSGLSETKFRDRTSETGCDSKPGKRTLSFSANEPR